ncbi:MAG: hypothetical protein WCD89_23220 [Anaerocolumna sp.]
MEEIRILKSEKELIEVGKFRYKVYIEEMKRIQKYADHKMKTIIEPEDTKASTRIIVAYSNKELIGTSRVHIYYPGDDVADLADYNIPKGITDRFIVTEGTKFMINPSLRGESNLLGKLMMKFAYELLLRENVDIDFLNANDYLLDYYGCRGYKKFGAAYFHKELRQYVYPMALLVKDYDYLQAIRSPFAEEKITDLEDSKRVEEIKKILF